MRAKLAKVGMRRSEAYLQRIRIPRDAWPGLDDVFACLENIFILDDQFEFWFPVFAHSADDSANDTQYGRK